MLSTFTQQLATSFSAPSFDFFAFTVRGFLVRRDLCNLNHNKGVYRDIFKHQNFLYYLAVNSLLNKLSILPILAVHVLSIVLASYFQNYFQVGLATSVDVNDQKMPFGMNNIFEIGQLQNETSENSANVTTSDNPQGSGGCDMPPCPPGQACIQSCS